MLGVSLSHLPPDVLRLSLFLNLGLTNWLGQLARKLQGLTCLCFPAVGLQTVLPATFYTVSGAPNCLHPCLASTLPTAPSPSSNVETLETQTVACFAFPPAMARVPISGHHFSVCYFLLLCVCAHVFVLVCSCVCMYVGVPKNICGDERMTCGSQFSPSALWALSCLRGPVFLLLYIHFFILDGSHAGRHAVLGAVTCFPPLIL